MFELRNITMIVWGSFACAIWIRLLVLTELRKNASGLLRDFSASVTRNCRGPESANDWIQTCRRRRSPTVHQGARSTHRLSPQRPSDPPWPHWTRQNGTRAKLRALDRETRTTLNDTNYTHRLTVLRCERPEPRLRSVNETICSLPHLLALLQCFDTVGWVAGRASGL